MAPRWGLRRRPAPKNACLSRVAIFLCVALFTLFAIAGRHQGRCGGAVRLALSVQVAPTSASQLPRLLSALWDPCNVYAVHLDTKIPPNERAALASLIREQYQSNVLVLASRPVSYAGVSMLLATLDALSALLLERDRVPWAFFINLSAADYPLVSPAALRTELSRPEVSGLSFFQTQHSAHPSSWFFTRRFGTVHIDPALWGIQGELARIDALHPVAAAGHVPLPKAEGWVILDEAFARHSVHSPDARRLLALFANARAPDEHYFPAIQALAPDRFPVAWDAMRYIAWRNATATFARPAFLDGPQGPALRAELMESGALFARKFMNHRSPILDDIDTMLAGRQASLASSRETREKARMHISRVRKRLLCAAQFRLGLLDISHRYEECRRA